MSHEQIRRALEDAKRRTGMNVGLPKVTVDASQLEALLRRAMDAAAALTDATATVERLQVTVSEEWLRAEKAEAELAAQRVFTDRLKQHLMQIITWQPIATLTCDEGPVLLYDEQWIDPHFNPGGIREGFRDESDTGPICSVRWNPCQDVWDTVHDDGGTHWRRQPPPPVADSDG